MGKIIRVFEKFQAGAVTAVQQVPDKEVSRYGCVKYAENPKYPNQMEKIIEKPTPEQAPSNMVQDGRFVFSSKAIKLLEKQSINLGELMITDTISSLIKTDVVIAEPIEEGFWTTTGDPLRWLKTNLIIALKEKKLKKEIIKFISEKGDNHG